MLSRASAGPDVIMARIDGITSRDMIPSAISLVSESESLYPWLSRTWPPIKETYLDTVSSQFSLRCSSSIQRAYRDLWINCWYGVGSILFIVCFLNKFVQVPAGFFQIFNAVLVSVSPEVLYNVSLQVVFIAVTRRGFDSIDALNTCLIVVRGRIHHVGSFRIERVEQLLFVFAQLFKLLFHIRLVSHRTRTDHRSSPLPPILPVALRDFNL